MPHNYTLVVKAKDCSFRFFLNLISGISGVGIHVAVEKIPFTFDTLNYDQLTITVEAIVMTM